LSLHSYIKKFIWLSLRLDLRQFLLQTQNNINLTKHGVTGRAVADISFASSNNKQKLTKMERETNLAVYELEASEFQWEIASGKKLSAWGFNQQVPGPVLKAKKGDTMVIRVKNNLLEPTIVHWHGIRLPAPMDGTGEVQKPIMPGEIFEYPCQ
jgi:FtsP/CotA-like multicopper oxidase with cupredoxin domain